MKKLIFSLLLCPIVVFADGNFNQGYQRGWRDGYKSVKGPYVVAPFAPFAPFPDFDNNDFEGGYSRGFQDGATEAQGD